MFLQYCPQFIDKYSVLFATKESGQHRLLYNIRHPLKGCLPPFTIRIGISPFKRAVHLVLSLLRVVRLFNLPVLVLG